MLDWNNTGINQIDTLKAPILPDFVASDSKRPDHGTKNLYAGFTIDMNMKLESLPVGQVLLDSRMENGQGLLVTTTEQGAVEIKMNDGRTTCNWDSDPILKAKQEHHITIIVDGGPKIISFVIDGQICDGGTTRQFGWGRFNPNIRSANGAKALLVSDAVSKLKIYDRPITVSEAVGNYRHK